MSRRRLRGRTHREADEVWPKLNAAYRLAMRIGNGQKAFDKIGVDSPGESFQRMYYWRNGEHFRTLPTSQGFTRRNPVTRIKFTISGHLGPLLRRTVDQEKPRIEAAGTEGRRYPTPNESEIVSIKMQMVVVKQCWPGHALRLQIVQQRRALSLS